MLKKAHSGDGDCSTSAAFLGLLTFILGLRFNLAVLMRERYSPLAHCPSFVSLCVGLLTTLVLGCSGWEDGTHRKGGEGKPCIAKGVRLDRRPAFVLRF